MGGDIGPISPKIGADIAVLTIGSALVPLSGQVTTKSEYFPRTQRISICVNNGFQSTPLLVFHSGKQGGDKPP